MVTQSSFGKCFTLMITLSVQSACSDPGDSYPVSDLDSSNNQSIANADQSAINPFFQESQLYLNYPPFDLIENSDYLPAFEQGMVEQLEELDAIVNQVNEPTFENTILPMEVSGQLLSRVSRVFFSLAGAHTNDAIRELEQELAPRLAAHNDKILLNPALYERISFLHERREQLKLDAQSLRLLEQYDVDM